MSLFGFISPFTMQAHFTTASSSGTASSLSSPSTSSQSSYTSNESHLQPPFASTSAVAGPTDDDVHFFPSRSPSPSPSAFDSYAAAPPPVAPVGPTDAAPVPAPQTSFAQAQAAMAAQNSSRSQNLIGQVIDNSSPHTGVSHLEFVSVLGLGAYGVVYLARDIAARPAPFPTSRAHPELGNLPLYAVKCLNKVGLDTRQRNFQQREINLHYAASQHPNVATLHNVIDDETCTYVVLEFCDEGDLFGMITERQRYLGDDELIRSVFLQIVDAVEYCHANGIFHRDLKPENILCVDEGEKVMLADFGLATGERMSGDFGCGSTFYMSPECQGGLFQRLSSYSTPHNDIWSLGVILVNLTCGRNPWKQACPSDETFCAYLGNPDFLRSILPISEHTNRILKRIFALNPQARISLAELRREILSVQTFVMSETELRHATRATKEAARAFAASKASRDAELEYVAQPQSQPRQARTEDILYEESNEDAMQEVSGEEDVFETSPPSTPWQQAESYSSPATPTQPPRKTPLTPPATPRRVPRAPPAPLNAAPHAPLNAAPHSPTSRRKRSDAPSTPPSQSHSTFEAYRTSTSFEGDDLLATPPSPVTPTSRRLTSPRRSPRSSARQLPNSRRRKTSVDSSSSSSGNSSQPATPTGLPPFATNGYAAAAPYAQKVRIAGEDGPVPVPTFRDLSLDKPCASNASTSSTLSAGTKAAYTAYYPIWSDDWADAARDQQASYRVELPPPVVLPAEMDAHDEESEDYQFPLPPSSGFYTRLPAPAPEEQLAH